jgi:hypothetical protein
MDFEFLAESLLDFVLEKEATVKATELNANKLEHLINAKLKKLSDYGTHEELFQQFLSPMEYMDMQTVWEVQSLYGLLLYQQQPERYPLGVLKLEPVGSRSPEQRGIDWLLAQVGYLNKPGLELAYKPISEDRGLSKAVWQLKQRYRESWGQCRWCGLPFYLNNPTQKLDTRSHYCHDAACDVRSAVKTSRKDNPYNHKNCCYGQWGIVKHQLTGTITKLKKAFTQESRFKDELTRVFMAFATQRYEEGCAKQYGVLTKADFERYYQDWEEQRSIQDMFAGLSQ